MHVAYQSKRKASINKIDDSLLTLTHSIRVYTSNYRNDPAN